MGDGQLSCAIPNAGTSDRNSAADASLLSAAVTFESTVQAGLVAHVDPDPLRRVLVNLIMNAAQAMGERNVDVRHHCLLNRQMTRSRKDLQSRDLALGQHAHQLTSVQEGG